MIIHIDGDSFFVSCEVLSRPDLRGKPVITGAERGIASSMNIEAKKIGITRGMPIFKIKKDFPHVIILPSNFGLYKQYNSRMQQIANRYSDIVEDYSIDECFVDVSHIDTWEMQIECARNLKQALKDELGLTFSLGLAPTKVLAKVASKNRKPDGFTAMRHTDIKDFLVDLPIGDVWGIGKSMSEKFCSVGVTTAIIFIHKEEEWVKRNFSLPYQTLWHELRGVSILGVCTEYMAMKSIQSTRTFPRNSCDREYVFSHLARNIEISCARLRRMSLYTKKISIFIKDNELRVYPIDVELRDFTNFTHEIVSQARKYFDSIFVENKIYKKTGVSCLGLISRKNMTQSLFDNLFMKNELYSSIDEVTNKYGEYAIVLASSMNAVKSYQKKNTKIEKKEKMISVPYLGEVV
ncbi:MAG: DNA polymerase IV [Candidatus Pacebacteria bacterium]|nr:DNA polymerase IV [Candidatus Paceibacterota bacterium]